MFGFLERVFGVGGAFEAWRESQVDDLDLRVNGEESPVNRPPVADTMAPMLAPAYEGGRDLVFFSGVTLPF